MSIPLSLSVILPTWNEANTIERTIHNIIQTGTPLEIVVVDGQSSDQTVSVVEALCQRTSGVNIAALTSPQRGRAAQMNHGASHATGDILLFLHADTLLHPGWEQAIRETLSQPDTSAGFFGYSLDTQTLGLQIIEMGVAVRAGLFNLPYGDQGLFLHRQLFQELGGYAIEPLMEDIEILRRLRSHGKIRQAPLAATTSARRFLRHGIFRTFATDALLSAGFHVGISPKLLARFYQFGN